MIQGLMKKVLSAWWLPCIVIELSVYLLWINRICSASAYLNMISHVWIYLFQTQSITEIHKFSFLKYAFVSSMKGVFMKRCLCLIHYIAYSNQGLIKTSCFVPSDRFSVGSKIWLNESEKKSAFSKGNESKTIECTTQSRIKQKSWTENKFISLYFGVNVIIHMICSYHWMYDLGQVTDFSVLQFLYLKNGYNNSSHLCKHCVSVIFLLLYDM